MAEWLDGVAEALWEAVCREVEWPDGLGDDDGLEAMWERS